MVNWKALTKSVSALAIYTYGKGRHRRRATRIQDTYGKIKRNAKARGIEFRLTPEFFARIWRDDCELCGIDFEYTPDRWRSRSADRKDSSQGYTHDNTRMVCYGCNITLSLHEIAARRRAKRQEPFL